MALNSKTPLPAFLQGLTDDQWSELVKGVAGLIKQEREHTARMIAEHEPATRVAKAVLDQHLKSLSDYASAFTTRRAKLLDGTPSPLLQAALGVGRGEV